MDNLVQKSTKRIHAQGGRMTAQRRNILETLESLDSHPSAEELYDIVGRKDPRIHLSTVYRTLRWLEQEGLISSRRFHEDRLQERFDTALPSEHHHFMCRACNRVIEFDFTAIDEIKSHFEAQFDAQVKRTTVVLYGLCTDCRQNQGTDKDFQEF
jgi:Fe2+ or Zn2+ uptake regulation protein